MENFDWSKFVLRIPIRASVQDLYDAWTSQNNIEHWFLRMARFKSTAGTLRGPEETVKPGDTYTWRWHGWPDEAEDYGEILACNDRDYFQFKFGKVGICTVRIQAENGFAIVELEQSQIPLDDASTYMYHVGCKTGWAFHLTNMKSIFEGGADLRNKDENLKEVLNS